jgi:4-amino-4-deoxy-L-arabinose transferase-like glycosyltransferase
MFFHEVHAVPIGNNNGNCQGVIPYHALIISQTALPKKRITYLFYPKSDIVSSVKKIFPNSFIVYILVLFAAHIFFSFYKLQERAVYGWDQVDNAWAAIRILNEGKYPLLGMIAKGNSGMYIGPFYYYLVALFYWVTHLNPIASPILAGCTSIFGFLSIYFVSHRLFGKRVAVWSCLIYTCSFSIIRTEHNQWPVNFIAPLSILIFYFLHESLTKHIKYLLPAAFFTGLAFHMHFTAVFYPVIFLCTLPWYPKTTQTLKFLLLSLVLFLLLQTPQIIYYFDNNTGAVGNYILYFNTYYHGLHLRRILQLVHDAFIEFEAIIGVPYKFLRPAVFLYVPLFMFLSWNDTRLKNKFILPYLTFLWIAVPWLIFSTYRGEITDYYFLIQLYLAVIIFAYITVWLLNRKNLFVKLCIIVFWLYFVVSNIRAFFVNYPKGNLLTNTQVVKNAIKKGEYIYFVEGSPNSYLYYYLLFINNKLDQYKPN